MPHKAFSFARFAVMVAVLAAVLVFLNWLPMILDRQSMRRYSSIEEVKAKLNIRDVLVPSYFPEDFKWPPSRIFAQGKPFKAVVMEFRQGRANDVALVISQAASADFPAPDGKIRISGLMEKANYDMKGFEAVLEVGTCEANPGETCSRIFWDERGYRLNLAAKCPPLELVRIARSMAH